MHSYRHTLIGLSALAICAMSLVPVSGCPNPQPPTTQPDDSDANTPDIPSNDVAATYKASWTADLSSPSRMALLSADVILVADPPTGRIARFDASGRALPAWDIAGGAAGVAVDRAESIIYVSLRDEPRVAVYSYDAAAGNISLRRNLGDASTAFVSPADLDVNPDNGDVYVVDGGADAVFQFSRQGALLHQFGKRGIASGEFRYPSAIAVDAPRGRVLLADQGNYRIQVFGLAAEFQGSFGERTKYTKTATLGWMLRTQGLAVSSEGTIYASDALLGVVRVFDPSGVELGSIGSYGSAPGQFRTPCDLVLSDDGARLFVANTNGPSVEVFDVPTTYTSSSAEAPIESSSELDPDGPANLERDGPHSLDGPSFCQGCHQFSGLPAGALSDPEGQQNVCLSCHSAGGRAATMALRPADASTLDSVSDPAAARGTSHAWNVPAVNPALWSTGPSNPTMIRYLADGKIKCATCHNQHREDAGIPYMRANNANDAMCRECHTGVDRSTSESGSHPVGMQFPAGVGEFPAADALAGVVLISGGVACRSCHMVHNAPSDDGRLLRGAAGANFCRQCHTRHADHNVSGNWRPTCTDCHQMHNPGNQNLAMVATQIGGTPIAFLDDDSSGDALQDFVHSNRSPPSYDGICEVCHTRTSYHRNAAGGNHTHNRNSTFRCIDCHPHSNGFRPVYVGE
ncbi:MAG: hypothetical protein HZB38_19380 [Planctomycetes bacterium]|nr:hypothetical protein [Planctomycetota bacterium]